MIGIDLVQISRISNVDALANKIFSLSEKELFNKANNKLTFLAGRFAAKEAFLKANHKGLGEIPLTDIEVLYNVDGAPYIKYMHKIYDVSISHDGDYATAIVNI